MLDCLILVVVTVMKVELNSIVYQSIELFVQSAIVHAIWDILIITLGIIDSIWHIEYHIVQKLVHEEKYGYVHTGTGMGNSRYVRALNYIAQSSNRAWPDLVGLTNLYAQLSLCMSHCITHRCSYTSI